MSQDKGRQVPHHRSGGGYPVKTKLSALPLPNYTLPAEKLEIAAEEVMVTADFPIIRMGFGKVEVGDATHEGLPALWFGRNGRGLDAPEQDMNRPAHDGETLVLFTFADIRGLDAIEKACARVRAKMAPND